MINSLLTKGSKLLKLIDRLTFSLPVGVFGIVLTSSARGYNSNFLLLEKQITTANKANEIYLII